LALALSLGLAACGSSAATPAPVPTSAGVHHASLSVDGTKRTYRIFLPGSLDLKRKAPLVLALHGRPSNGDEMATISNFDTQASIGGFIAVYPDGSNRGWYPDTAGQTYNVTFITRLLGRLESDYPVDKTRVFIVGVSDGAGMTYELACKLSDRFAAMASVAGAMPLENCNPTMPVSVIEMHGTNDSTLKYAGAVDAIHRWVALDGCVGGPTLRTTGITETSLWKGCKDGTAVRLDSVLGGYHQWFGSAYAPVPGEPDSNSTIWDFFSSLARPG